MFTDSAEFRRAPCRSAPIDNCDRINLDQIAGPCHRLYSNQGVGGLVVTEYRHPDLRDRARRFNSSSRFGTSPAAQSGEKNEERGNGVDGQGGESDRQQTHCWARHGRPAG
jgi:hypothetical protein